ncbi:DNA cytosine methyltransferase [Yoonia sp. 208BN28-4]|uniref:DNA cytosine methyltransferase n=1 Tax=Yoonia sp. 208BN28-4 TaxID=3126505 RepID=UPI0030A22F21
MRFIDLFAGCGGLSLGLSLSGWKGVFAIEKNEDAFKTLIHNFQKKKSISFSWPEWLPKEAMSTSDLIDRYRIDLIGLRGTIDMICGGPPCQGFSFAGRRKVDDPRNQLKNEYLEIVDLVRPKFLMFENVKGFTARFQNSSAPTHSEQVVKQLHDYHWGGYKTFSKIINASVFGVPQPRPRFILIAVRADLLQEGETVDDPFETIESHASNFRDRKKLNGHEITVKEAISDLEVALSGTIPSVDTKGFQQIVYNRSKGSTYQALMKAGVEKTTSANSLRLAKHRPQTIQRFQEILETCPKGKSLPKAFREKYNIRKQCFTPLHPDELSKTITTLPDDLLHYSEPRILTVRECARLQSFPDWFEFLGKYTTGGARRKLECPRYTQVGNAVPPLMAEALGQIIFEMHESIG